MKKNNDICRNEVHLSGYLTKDPILRQTKADSKVCNYTVEVKRPNTEDIIDFIDCVAWDKIGEEIANEYKAGYRIEVFGMIVKHTVDREDGRKTFYEVKTVSHSHPLDEKVEEK